MPRRQRIARRSAVTMLASLAAGMRPMSAVGAPSAEARQVDLLQRSDFADARGKHHQLAELTRPLLLVNLWAAWCPGCLTELPSIRTLPALLGANAIDVVLLSHGMNWGNDVAYARRTEIPFHHWRLPPGTPDADVATAFRIEDDRFGLPQSLILAGSERVLIAANLGTRDWSSPDQIRLIRSWLASAH
jgi:hypothetical protein